MSAVRRALVLAAVLALAAGSSAGCRSSQSRAHLPASLAIEPGVTTKREVLEAWGSPAAIRDEPGGRTVLVFRNDYGEGWAFMVGAPLPMTWLLAASSTRVDDQSAEFHFLADGTLEKVRLRSRQGMARVIE